jgi:integrase
MSQEIVFSEKRLEGISRKPTGKRMIYRDKKCPGLVFVIEASGSCAFAWYKKVFGRATWKKIGGFPDCSIDDPIAYARSEASKFNSNVLKGNDPFTTSDGVTLKEAFERYCEERLEEKKNPQKAIKNAKWQFDKYLLAWHDRKLDTIKRPDVNRLQRQLRKSHRLYTSNRVTQLLRAVVNHAVKKKIWNCKAEDNPVANLELYTEHERDRFIQPDEMAAVWKQLDAEGNLNLRDFVILALSTGARKGDLLSMRWKDIYQSATGEKFWRVPEPKNKKPYNIPLLPDALDVLAARHKRNGKSDWVFPREKNKKQHLTDPKKAWTRFRKKIGCPDLRIHDLRRTTGSWQAAQGASLQIIGKSLGHSSSAATEIYSQLNLDPVRQSMTKAYEAMRAARALPENSNA